MTTDTTKAPHCPRCGNARDELWALCPGCHFNAKWRDGHGWRAAGPWEPAVRAELARQALEMRAHSEHFRDDDGFDRPALWASLSVVLTDYEWLGTHPLRLPGEEA